jgi:hypothetical protein
MAPRIDITGQRFGRLLVLRYAGRAGRWQHGRWDCVCTCGTRTTVWDNALRQRLTRSCGCLRREDTARRALLYAARKREARGIRPVRNRQSPEYGVWLGMKQRCLNPRNGMYHRYGGRGITIDPRWLASFDAFYDDMGPRPRGTTLDRVNNDGNYEASNCRWATVSEQHANQTHRTAPRRGVAASLAKLTDADVAEIRRLFVATPRPTQWDLARRYGVTQSAIWAILHRRTWTHVP